MQSRIARKFYFIWREESLYNKLSGYSLFILIFSFFTINTALSQWRKIATFHQPVGCIFILDSGKTQNYTAFAGTSSLFTKAEAWKTTDGGKSWKKVFKGETTFENAVTAFTFKDSLTGWLSVSEVGGCFKTIDGGNTWTKLALPPTNTPLDTDHTATAVYYHKFSKILLLSQSDDIGLQSFDEGATWKPFGTPQPAHHRDGYAFIDSLNGIVACEEEIPSDPIRYFYNTTDGGFTWNRLTFYEKAAGVDWQPVAFDHSFFTMGDGTNTLYLSDDLGITWKAIYTFPTSFTGTLGCDSNAIYFETGGLEGTPRHTFINPVGFLKSIDKGLSWQSICGPDNFMWTRFYVSNYGIWAGDSLGGLWFNRTKKSSGPRLQIEKNNTIRHITASTSPFPVSIYYSHESYFESVDSLTFIVKYSGALQYLRDSVCAGWTVIRREITDSTMRFILRRIDPSAPALDTLLLKIYFQGVVAKQTTGVLTLDEINFNQDVTFHDCMIASLLKTDSLFIDIQDQCGDSILRNFITTGKILSITSIHPNPATESSVIVLLSIQQQPNATISMFDVLGRVVYHKDIISGISQIEIPIQNLSDGIYSLQLTSLSGSVSQKFVKIR